MILMFNWVISIKYHMIVILLNLLPPSLMRRNLLMWRVIKHSMRVGHENNNLCDSYIIEFVHHATKNYYERLTHGYRYLNNIKFPLFMFKILKLHLFSLSMLVDSCFNKLFDYKIPIHRKWVRLKCVCYMIHDAPFMFQFLFLCEHH